MTNNERREAARRHLDATERWLHRLIAHALIRDFGESYSTAEHQAGGGFVIPLGTQEYAQELRKKNPTRFSSDLEAITLGQAVEVVLHPRHYGARFEAALKRAYPSVDDARIHLARLVRLRNQTSHLPGTCSERDLEQAACYSNDLIDAIKAFFLEAHLERLYNVPTFTRLVDNIGNDLSFSGDGGDLRHTDFRKGEHGDLYPGDILKIETEVDENFTGYKVKWIFFTGERMDGNNISLAITNKHVRERFIIHVELASGADWHKLHNDCDDRIELNYHVLPAK